MQQPNGSGLNFIKIPLPYTGNANLHSTELVLQNNLHLMVRSIHAPVLEDASFMRDPFFSKPIQTSRSK